MDPNTTETNTNNEQPVEQPSQPTVESAEVMSPPEATTDMPPTPPAVTSPPDASEPVVGAADPMTAAPKGKMARKPLLMALIAVVVLGGGAAAYYFGYYMSPSVILSQSLTNTGKGYDKLVNYLETQSQANYKGAVGSGSYSFKSGGTSTDGSLSFKSDGTNSDTSFDVGLVGTRINAEIRTIKSAGATPDIYLKASGITGLGALTGSAEADTAINKLDGKWIVVDHTLIDSLQSQLSQTQAKSASQMPAEADVLDEVQAFGGVNKQYVFTTNKSKSVTVVVQKYGTETVDGHKAYHYKMGFDKANVKRYITAQRDALKASKLGAWLKKNNYDTQVDSSYADLEKSADTIKSSDTFDLWSDVSSRLVYKVRVSDKSNPATNYVDLGLNYKGGTSYPFFISGQSKDGSTTSSGSIVVTLDSKDNSVALKISIKGGGTDASTFTANLTFKPSSAPVAVSAPTGAEPLMQVLDDLGLGQLFQAYAQSAASAGAASQNSNNPYNYFTQ